MIIKQDQQAAELRRKRNGKIKDFFKPYAARSAAPTSSLKRERDKDTPQCTADDGRQRSKSPRLGGLASPNPNPAAAALSSELSSLSSLSSPGRSSSAPIETAEPAAAAPAYPTKSSSMASDGLASSSAAKPGSRGSQRVTRDGEDMVLDSSDDASSLEDVDELLGRFQGKVPAPPPDLPAGASSPPLAAPPDNSTPGLQRSARGAAQQSAGHGVGGRGGADDVRANPPPPVVPRYRNSMATLKARIQKERAADTAYQEARRRAEEVEQQAAAQLRQDHGLARLDGNALAPMLAGEDPEDAERLMRAVERTQALQQQKSWSFFRRRHERPQVPAFPDLGGDDLQPMLEGKQEREMALVSGFVAEVAASRALPHALLEWLLAMSIAEEREDLRAAALQILQEAGPALTGVLTKEVIHELFRSVGASDEALDFTAEIQLEASASGGSSHGQDWSGVLQVLALLENAADSMEPSSRAGALLILILLCADSSAILTPNVPGAIETAITALIHAEEDAAIISNVLARSLSIVADPQLRLQIIHTLPAAAPRTAAFRRQYACASLLDPDAEPSSSPLDPAAAARRLTELRTHAIGPRTDYAALAAQIASLDIALGDGGLAERADRGDDDAPWRARFDRAVDALAETVRAMAARIVDTGASHMARTDAKEALQALHARLEYGVRSRPRPKTSIFAEGDAEREPGSGALMRKFLGKGAEGKKTAVGKGEEKIDS